MSALELQKRIAQLDFDADTIRLESNLKLEDIAKRREALTKELIDLNRSNLNLSVGSMVYNIHTHVASFVVESKDVPLSQVATSRRWESVAELIQSTLPEFKTFFSAARSVCEDKKAEIYVLVGDKFRYGIIEMCNYHGWNLKGAHHVQAEMIANYFPIHELVYQRYNASWSLKVNL